MVDAWYKYELNLLHSILDDASFKTVFLSSLDQADKCAPALSTRCIPRLSIQPLGVSTLAQDSDMGPSRNPSSPLC